MMDWTTTFIFATALNIAVAGAYLIGLYQGLNRGVGR
jgi:hypothetical protein